MAETLLLSRSCEKLLLLLRGVWHLSRLHGCRAPLTWTALVLWFLLLRRGLLLLGRGMHAPIRVEYILYARM